MKFINSLKERFTKEQLMIIATALSLSTPFYICVPFYYLKHYTYCTLKIINAFKSTPKSKYLIIFMLLTLAISLIYKLDWCRMCRTYLYLCFTNVILSTIYQ